jgi:alkanesulfonate monooxygenase SsuD/methylene tetrahydromethanopterin reductase-like flavin-dependent oxidoreductase (luciferase family)
VANQRDLEFGYFLVPLAGEPLIATAQRVETLGLDYVGIQDHPYQRRFVDTWSLIAMIAAATTRLRIFSDVANLPLRPPAVLAKAAATIDLLSGGRFELGIGAGGFWDAIEAYGGQRRTPGEAVEALEEAVTLIRQVWSGERNLRFAGRYYQLSGANSGPVPPRRIGIWIGAARPRMLDLVARLADGWVPSFQGDLEQLAAMTRSLDAAVAAAGRSPGDIRRILNVAGVITDGSSQGMLKGPPEQWGAELTELAVSLGFETFIFWGEGEGQLERFAREVVPAVRSQFAEAQPRAY